MANGEGLPSEFDIILLGTGLTETIAAAAFSRIGLKILHLDRNDFYGGTFGNFNFEGIEAWKNANQDIQDAEPCDVTEETHKLLNSGESAVGLPMQNAQAYNIKSEFHIRERTDIEQRAAEAKKPKPFQWFTSGTPVHIPDAHSDHSTSEEASSEEQAKEEKNVDSDKDKNESKPPILPPKDLNCSESLSRSPSASSASVPSPCPEINESVTVNQVESNQCEGLDEAEKAKREEISHDETVEPGGVEESTSGDSGCHADMTSESVSSSLSSPQSEGPGKEVEEESTQSESSKESERLSTIEGDNTSGPRDWTVGDIIDDGKRYCFDLSPRVLHCSGELVELLIQSDVSRYCEFRTVSRVLTLLKDSLQQVPCSRADVFSSKIVSLIEKRLMMKFLQFATDYESNPSEYTDFADRPYIDFLKSKKLTSNIQHFVQHAIAMVTNDASTEEGLKKTKKFLQSLGRYGNTAFLFPLYGIGDIPQGFARMSSVFEGIYCLSMTASHLVTDSENKCCGIVTSSGQKVSCRYLIAEVSYVPPTFVSNLSNRKYSRAIYITNKSICPSKEEELSLMNFPSKTDPGRPVTIFELPHSACVCPKNVFVVHMTRESTGDAPEEDFDEVRERLFASHQSGCDSEKPKILWSMHFTQKDRSNFTLSDKVPGNVLLATGGGDGCVDLDSCVSEAERIFKTVCPDEDFLPKPPNPEDIIHVDDTETSAASGPSEFEVQDTDKDVDSVDATETSSESTILETDAIESKADLKDGENSKSEKSEGNDAKPVSGN